MTTIGILGSGRVGTTLATKLAAAGHHVLIGSRTPSTRAAAWSGPSTVQHADHAHAAHTADLVINATPGDTSLEVLGGLATALRGKILIDIANATERGPDGLPTALLHLGTSLAELIQSRLPGTKVVKTLNTMLFTVMTDPSSLSAPPSVFLSGDDAAAKLAATGLLADLGWLPESITDLGSLATAQATEAFVLLVPSLFRTYGPTPFALTIAR